MVAVVMTTWDDGSGIRHGYMRRCLQSWWDYVDPSLRLRYVVADDGSKVTPEVQVPYPYPEVQVVHGRHNGIGASLNRALQFVEKDEPWIYTTDDWKLPDMYDDSAVESVNFELALWLLTQGYDVVRLGPIHPNLECTTMFQAGHGWWLDLHTSSQWGGFHFATRPFLAAPSLVQKVGPFEEGVDAYACEKDYSERVRDHGGISIAAINLAGPWEHIGEYEVGDRPVLAEV